MAYLNYLVDDTATEYYVFDSVFVVYMLLKEKCLVVTNHDEETSPMAWMKERLEC